MFWVRQPSIAVLIYLSVFQAVIVIDRKLMELKIQFALFESALKKSLLRLFYILINVSCSPS